MAGLTNNVGAPLVAQSLAKHRQTRPRDHNLAMNGTDNERAPHASLGWGGSIWNTNGTTVGASFGSGVRDNSRPRDTSTYMGSPVEPIEGKTGSGSLVASSESDGWHTGRTAWRDSTSGISLRSGASPARKRSIAQPDPAPQFGDKSTNFFPTSRPAAVGHGLAKTTKPLLDPTSVNFTSNRRVDPLNTSNFSAYGFNQVDAPQRAEASAGSWHDAASVHSPTDDRRSVANSDNFGPSSATPSRSGSLPPSRHGNEPFQIPQFDNYPRFQQPGQRQTSSFSIANSRAFQERSSSIQSDSLPMLSQLNLGHDASSGAASHRPSMSINGFNPSFSPAVNEASLARDNFTESQNYERSNGFSQPGTYTPDSVTNGNSYESTFPFRPVHFDSHSAPNGTGAHQSPHHTHSHTPPAFDHLYPSRSEQTYGLNSNNIALVNQRLTGHKMQQQELRRQGYQQQQMHPQQFQQMIAANHLRNSFQYQQLQANNMPLSNLQPNVAMAPVHGVLPLEPPRAPRDHSAPPELAAMSACLYNFKAATKTGKKYELKEIYGYVVEFSGDQHGSRFIQLKLEGANSDEKEKIFRELQENCLQLMQDVFGNYVIQKFFEHGDQSQKKFLANKMMGHILHLSNGMYGCRVVQKALEYVLTDQQALMVKELEKDVLKCVRDQNGNHVIQKVIDRVPLVYIKNIIEAFRGQVGALAVNTYGCRVIQRLLEKVPEPQRRFILMELHAEGPKLISDQYGNYVCQHVIEHGLPEDRAKVILLVKAQVLVFSKHKFASNVVERCLSFGNNDQRRTIMLNLIEKNERGENNLQSLIKDGYGNYVIQKLLDKVCRRDYDELVAALKPELEKAKKIMSGKQVISVEKKMHRVDFEDGPDADTPPTPPLTSEAQSPQSSSLPSATASTVDEPVHTSLANKNFPAPIGDVSIENAS